MLQIPRISDFSVEKPSPDWDEIPWVSLQRTEGNAPYHTLCRLAYSQNGLYIGISCEDEKLTCSLQKDNADIYTEDVVEFFFQPDPEKILYFEYELSPLGYELPLMVPNHKGVFMGWLPWHYEDDRKVQKQVVVVGGAQLPGGKIQRWDVTIFIPFALLKGLGNVPPVSGTIWRGNVNRLDYDGGACTKWALNEAVVGEFHDYTHFGSFIFT